MLKQILCGGVAFSALALSAFGAQAAPGSFHGFYVGVHGGYAFSDGQDAVTTGTPGFLGLGAAVTPRSLELDADGFTGGVQVGWNWVNNHFVWGLEADLAFADLDDEAFFSGAPIIGLAPTGLTTRVEQESNLLGSARARLGWLVTPQALLFVTGGFAFADAETRASVVVNGNPALRWDGISDDWQSGYVLGAGGEFEISPGMTLRLDYTYYDLGDETVSALGNAAVRGVAGLNGIDYVTKIDNEVSVVRIGLNFRH